MTFSTILGVTEILCSFILVLEGEKGKEMTESLRLEFLETFSGNNFDLRWLSFSTICSLFLLAVGIYCNEDVIWSVSSMVCCMLKLVLLR